VAEQSRRQLIITGGWAHPFERTTAFLAEVLHSAGFDSIIAYDLDEAATALATGQFDLITVYACWFGMSDERYDAVRSEWARTSSPALRDGISAHLGSGRGVLALHTAPICFDDWPEWPSIVGGSWNWHHSWHPQPGEVSVEPSGEHPIIRGIGQFSVIDERYTDLDVSPDVDVIAWSVAEDRQAAIWTHSVGPARVVYDALGHDERSLGHGDHAVVLRRCALWAAGAPDAQIIAMR